MQHVGDEIPDASAVANFVELLVEELVALLQRPHAHLGDLESVSLSLRHRDFRQAMRVLDAFNTFQDRDSAVSPLKRVVWCV